MNSGTKFFFALIAGVVVLAVFFKGSPAGALKYSPGFRQALKKAGSDEKPILLNFGGPW